MNVLPVSLGYTFGRSPRTTGCCVTRGAHRPRIPESRGDPGVVFQVGCSTSAALSAREFLSSVTLGKSWFGLRPTWWSRARQWKPVADVPGMTQDGSSRCREDRRRRLVADLRHPDSRWPSRPARHGFRRGLTRRKRPPRRIDRERSGRPRARPFPLSCEPCRSSRRPRPSRCDPRGMIIMNGRPSRGPTRRARPGPALPDQQDAPPCPTSTPNPWPTRPS